MLKVKKKDLDERDSAKAAELLLCHSRPLPLLPVEFMGGKQLCLIMLDTFERSVIMLQCVFVTGLIKRIKY